MKSLCHWLQRAYILSFLLFAWYIAPFTRFAPLFPLAWSLTVAASAFLVPVRTSGREEPPVSIPLLQAVVVGLLVGLILGAADWSQLDLTLLFECAWALMPLFLFDRFFTWAWSHRLHPMHR